MRGGRAACSAYQTGSHRGEHGVPWGEPCPLYRNPHPTCTLAPAQPQRGGILQPRAAPWVWDTTQGRALKGRSSCVGADHGQWAGLVRPFRARAIVGTGNPGRCPGLAWDAPSGRVGVAGQHSSPCSSASLYVSRLMRGNECTSLVTLFPPPPLPPRTPAQVERLSPRRFAGNPRTRGTP